MVSVARGELPERIGRYLVFGAFARGGMASIHLGRLTGPARFSRLVAVKVLHPVYAGDREYCAMLLDEARLSSRIVHPNVVQTLDVVQENDQLCIVMEYVHGISLANAMSSTGKSGERTPPAIASAILTGVLNGLHAAHEARGEDGAGLGIVHRDVSPQNVVVGLDGVARVLDFGVAKARGKEQVTREGHVKGKIPYMAPEQLTGAPVTRQADIRAAGVVLWEVLAGRRLFEEENEARLITRVLSETVPPPSSAAPEISEALDEVVGRAAAFDRRARFATAQEMAEALASAVPPAPAQEVAAWVERVGGDLLDARAHMIRVAEALGAAADPDARDAAADVTALVTRVERVDDGVERPRRGNRWAAAVAVVLAIACAVVGLRASRAPAARASSSSAGALPQATPAPPVEPAAAPTSESSSPTALQIDPVVIPMSVTDGGSAGAAGGAGGRRGSVRPPAQFHSHGARVACDPPFSIDSEGMKHYKASCLP